MEKNNTFKTLGLKTHTIDLKKNIVGDSRGLIYISSDCDIEFSNGEFSLFKENPESVIMFSLITSFSSIYSHVLSGNLFCSINNIEDNNYLFKAKLKDDNRSGFVDVFVCNENKYIFRKNKVRINILNKTN